MTLMKYLNSLPLGSATKLAARLRVSPATLSQWRNQRRPVPAARCIAIERATEGAVTCETLRPDLHWYVVRNGKAPR